MKESRKKLLQRIYDYDQLEGTPLQINFDDSDTNIDFDTLQNDVYYLKLHGYISEFASTLSSYSLVLTEKGEQFVENDFKSPSEIPTGNVFNIENATNSVIGTQANVTMNIEHSIQEAKEQINSSTSEDKEELHQIISLLEMVVNNQIPAQKGLLSKFSATIQRNSWIASPITSIFLKWLTTL